MKCSRREMLLASVGLVIAGCTQTPTRLTGRPRPHWPEAVARPRPGGVSVAPPRPAATSAPSTAAPGPLNAVSRAQWASRDPIANRVNPMNGVSRVTVHHEGWTPVWFTDTRSTAARIEQIRNIHVRDRGWGDIGYHYIIDRAGRVWEGRPLRYQGAHVAGKNEHNIGIMCLGNFDKQRPSDAQLQALVSTLRSLKDRYRVPVSRMHTHQELTPTACPGSQLQPRIVSIRSNGYLA